MPTDTVVSHTFIPMSVPVHKDESERHTTRRTRTTLPLILGDFEDVESIESEFRGKFPRGAELLLAWYEYENYSGEAYVLYRADGKLWVVEGGHCSCNGLEDQWDPVETTIELLRKEVERQKANPPYRRTTRLLTEEAMEEVVTWLEVEAKLERVRERYNDPLQH